MAATATITKIDDEQWSVVVEKRNRRGSVVLRNGSTVIGKETEARKFAREIGGKGTKITVSK